METLWSALISAGGAIAICLINNAVQNGTTRKLIEYRLKELESKVDKHNNLIERTYNLEKAVAIIEEQIKKGDDGK